jgi:hypothetical protein
MLLFFIVISITLLYVCSLVFPIKPCVLSGTYLCDELPFSFMVFDRNDDYTFYYYFQSNLNGTTNQMEDKGSYLEKDKSVYVINSSNFVNEEIVCKKNKFDINIDGVKYTFKKSSDIPTIIIQPDKD